MNYVGIVGYIAGEPKYFKGEKASAVFFSVYPKQYPEQKYPIDCVAYSYKENGIAERIRDMCGKGKLIEISGLIRREKRGDVYTQRVVARSFQILSAKAGREEQSDVDPSLEAMEPSPEEMSAFEQFAFDADLEGLGF